MKKAIAILTLIIAMYSCKKDYEFKDEKDKTKTAKRDPDNQPKWVNLTTVILYSNYQFDISWSYQYVLNPSGGGSYAIGNFSYNVGGAGNGHTITKYPAITSINGNIVTFVVRITDTYFMMIPNQPNPASNIVETIIMTIKYNLTTKSYTVTYSHHSKW